jgi:hypothetical protein
MEEFLRSVPAILIPKTNDGSFQAYAFDSPGQFVALDPASNENFLLGEVAAMRTRQQNGGPTKS